MQRGRGEVIGIGITNFCPFDDPNADTTRHPIASCFNFLLFKRDTLGAASLKVDFSEISTGIHGAAEEGFDD